MSEDHGPKEMKSEANIHGDDEIIDLTDQVIAPSETEEEIIDLTDMVEEPSSQTLEISEPGQKGEIPGKEDQSDEAPVTETVDDIQFGDALDEEIESEEVSDDFVNALGMDLEEATEVEEKDLEGLQAEAMSLDQIEAAIERVLMKILPEKIERILVATIEKTVTKEIKKLKGALLDE